MNITTTFNNEGKAMTETYEGIEMPADYSFATVNDYVHQAGRTYEDLEALCLGMACEIDRLRKALDPAAYFISSASDCSHETTVGTSDGSNSILLGSPPAGSSCSRQI